MSIRCIYASEPSFPATDQDPAAVRVKIGAVWVDYTGAVPVQSDIDAVLSPDLAAGDLSRLNSVLVENGSVVRALGLVMFAEINKLRVKNSDPPYTLAQFKTALQAQMR